MSTIARYFRKRLLNRIEGTVDDLQAKLDEMVAKMTPEEADAVWYYEGDEEHPITPRIMAEKYRTDPDFKKMMDENWADLHKWQAQEKIDDQVNP